MPDNHYLYCFDNAGFPLFRKSEETIIHRTLDICKKLTKIIHLMPLLVLAIPRVRWCYRLCVSNFIPIVGTVPAIKPAAEISQTKHIDCWQQKARLNALYVNDLIHQFASHCVVERLGSTKLVEIAEHKIQGKSVDLIALKNELTPWVSIEDLDTICLRLYPFPFN